MWAIIHVPGEHALKEYKKQEPPAVVTAYTACKYNAKRKLITDVVQIKLNLMIPFEH